MFSSVAKRYDLANTLMSWGLHYSWKRFTAEQTGLQEGDKAIDICSGTNDLAILLAKKVGPTGRVTAVDFNARMLEVGKYKVEKAGLSDSVTCKIGDAENLPLPDDTFNAATIAVASRHLRVNRAFAEMYRVLKPGGQVVCLEFFQPPNVFFRRLYDFYSYHLMWRIGKWVTRDKTGVYEYLPNSIRVFYTPEKFKEIMEKVGFVNVKYQPLNCGIVYVHTGEKPNGSL